MVINRFERAQIAYKKVQAKESEVVTIVRDPPLPREVGVDFKRELLLRSIGHIAFRLWLDMHEKQEQQEQKPAA